MDVIQLAAALAGVVLVASIVSVEAGVTVALVELTLGVVVGNVFHLRSQDWLDFVASFASIVLTFLAGMEVDPAYMRRRLEASLGIGIASFAGPFVVAALVAYALLDWTVRASLIAGTALSTTSLAVVYAVLVERGLTDTGELNVSLGAVFANLGILALLVAAKLAPKLAFVAPLARRAAPRHAAFATLLMSTGLTFGTISSLYGLNAGIVDGTQFSLLVTVVVLSAVAPTAIAERAFLPDADEERRLDRRRTYAQAEEYV
jgi:Kef-type K+ transport system membrane component KefB